MTKNETILTLFRDGQYSQCSSLIKSILKEKSSSLSRHNDIILQLCTENNLFVSDQLAENWETPDLKDIAYSWEKGMQRALDIHRSLRLLQLSSDVPNEIALCIVYNTLFWAVMNIDPFLQHKSLLKDIQKISILTLRRSMTCLGDFNLRGPCVNTMEEFIFLGQSISPRLLELQPDQCHLLINIFNLFLLLILDELSDKELSRTKDCIKITETLLSASSQLKLHILSLTEGAKHQRRYPKLFKFGFFSHGEVLDAQYHHSSVAYSLEAVNFIGSVIYLRLKEYKDAVGYLNLLQNPKLSFLFHYLKAVIELEQENVDVCLYQLSRAPISNSNFFMQARLCTLKAQALFLAKKPFDALHALDKVHFDQREVQLPVTAFVLAQLYGEVGKIEQKIEVLNLLLKCLSADPAVQPMLISPLVGLEHRILLSAYHQPEVTYADALYACAAARLPHQPQEASEHLIELLRVIEFKTDIDIQKLMKHSSAVTSLTDILHDTVSTLLEADSAAEAVVLCQACIKTHQDRVIFVNHKINSIRCLQDDVIGLMLLAEAQVLLNSSDVFDTLNMSAKLLHEFLSVQGTLCKSKENDEETNLAKQLLARVYLQKAQLNIKRNLSEDALASFQRALNFNRDDPEILLSFADHLMKTNQFEESLTLWTLFTDKKEQHSPRKPSLKHLLGDKMNETMKQDIILRLQSLIETQI